MTTRFFATMIPTISRYLLSLEGNLIPFIASGSPTVGNNHIQLTLNDNGQIGFNFSLFLN